MRHGKPQLVMVIHSNQEYVGGTLSDMGSVPFPPVGTVGELLSGIDEFNEVDVLFPNHPCPGIDPSWVSHVTMLMFLDDSYKHATNKIAQTV